MENLIDYAGFDNLDATLTKEKVIAIATTNLICNGYPDLTDLQLKVLGL